MGFLSKAFSVSLAALTVVNAGEIIKLQDPSTAIEGEYVVVMNDEVSQEEFDTHRSWAATAGGPSAEVSMGSHFLINKMKGYMGAFDEVTLEEIANDPAVKFVEPNQVMKALALETQKDVPSWGLSRISSQQSGGRDYTYDSTAGEGITIYGVDTGIDVDNADFEGRAEWGTNEVDSDDSDGNGHGTHTASTMAGTEYGVAKKASLVAVKVLDSSGSGSTSGIVSGIEWVANDAQSRGAAGKAVMNLSLGGSFSQALNDAATNAVNEGVFLAVAAGNDAADAGDYSPASAEGVCTVGATNEQDSIAEFSNFGEVVAIMAPGEDITAAVPGGSSETMSGTSMASPHVAGVAAYLMALEGIEVGQTCGRIQELANSAVSGVPSGTTDKLLFNGVESGNFTIRRPRSFY